MFQVLLSNFIYYNKMTLAKTWKCLYCTQNTPGFNCRGNRVLAACYISSKVGNVWSPTIKLHLLRKMMLANTSKWLYCIQNTPGIHRRGNRVLAGCVESTTLISNCYQYTNVKKYLLFVCHSIMKEGVDWPSWQPEITYIIKINNHLQTQIC